MKPETYSRLDQPLLELKDVCLSYGDKQILKNINAKVTNLVRPQHAQGQVIAFLGPSGMGKTQLARIITGLQKPSSGAVILDGDVPTRKGLVGLVPQNYPLFEFLSVEGNLEVARRQGGGAPVSKIAEYVKLLGLEDYLKAYPKALSGGTRQRVAIARQLLCCANYLVMDEPFSGLDPIMKANASEAIAKLVEGNDLMTVIVITHDISEGLAIADTAWLLGKSMEDGATLRFQYDLAQLGFAWHPDILGDPEFQKFVGEVKMQFRELINPSLCTVE